MKAKPGYKFVLDSKGRPKRHWLTREFEQVKREPGDPKPRRKKPMSRSKSVKKK